MLLEPLILAKNGEGELVQLLIFAVVAVLWFIGGLLKARANKAPTKEFSPQPKTPDHAPQAMKPQLLTLKTHPRTLRFKPPKPAPKVAHIPAEPPRTNPPEAPRVPTQPPTRPHIPVNLRSARDLKQAFILSEIISPPVSLRAEQLHNPPA